MTIEAFRSLHRHGGAHMMERAFTGFVALEHKDMNWRSVLNLAQDATLEDVEQAYRRLAQQHHPDRGGSPEMFSRITTARSQAREAMK